MSIYTRHFRQAEAAFRAAALPVRYLQLDAWWYKQKGSMPPDGPWFPGCIQVWPWAARPFSCAHAYLQWLFAQTKTGARGA
jgi:hypothetical protein